MSEPCHNAVFTLTKLTKLDKNPDRCPNPDHRPNPEGCASAKTLKASLPQTLATTLPRTPAAGPCWPRFLRRPCRLCFRSDGLNCPVRAGDARRSAHAETSLRVRISPPMPSLFVALPCAHACRRQQSLRAAAHVQVCCSSTCTCAVRRLSATVFASRLKVKCAHAAPT